jgi:bifunctional DNase/RNase
MRTLQFVNIYRRKNAEIQTDVAWLCDITEQWALDIPISQPECIDLLLLKQEETKGPYEALSPSNLPFLTQLLSLLQARIVSVEIHAILERAFYATATLQQGEQTFQIDGRVGLLLVLAQRFSIPISIEDELLDRLGTRFPLHTTLQQWLAEEQANLDQPLLPLSQIPSALAKTGAIIAQAGGKLLSVEQQQQIQTEIQQHLGPEQRKQLQNFLKNAPPEVREASRASWSRLGFSASPFERELLGNDNEII